MYFPFLRGKQYEFLCLIDLKEILNFKGNVMPIIEPVKSGNMASKYFVKLQKNDIPFIIISNPFVGEFKSNPNNVKKDIVDNLDKNKIFTVAYQIKNDTNKSDIEDFIIKYEGFNKCFIHQKMYRDLNELLSIIKEDKSINFHVVNNTSVSSEYKKSIQNRFDKVVLLEDGFKKQARNADYPSDSYFSDIMLKYKNDGFYGHGDYLTVGDKYDESGSTPYAVAIHYSHFEDTYLSIKHFISDRRDDQKDTAGKFLEALEKLVEFLNDNYYVNTKGTSEFMSLYAEKHYPGLGKIKEISMKHHIELLSTY
ncbi:MAG: hypothetical protein K0R54_3635 [Clostridiaceae bacterium]|jgi:hypothetical protein|nr:hypothetical protein [Clostridiaceae bacterium]